MEAALPLSVPLASVGPGAGASLPAAAPAIRKSLPEGFAGVTRESPWAGRPAAAVGVAAVPRLYVTVRLTERRSAYRRV